MKAGDKIKNFELVEEIKTVDDLIFELENRPSIFWRNKVISTSFFFGWPLRLILITIQGGYFWKVKRIDKQK